MYVSLVAIGIKKCHTKIIIKLLNNNTEKLDHYRVNQQADSDHSYITVGSCFCEPIVIIAISLSAYVLSQQC